MSEFSQHQIKRNKVILEICLQVDASKNPIEHIRRNQQIVDSITPKEIVWVVDELVKNQFSMDRLKTGINKFLNLFSTALVNYDNAVPEKGTFFSELIYNNHRLEKELKDIRPLIKSINMDPKDSNVKSKLILAWQNIQKFDAHYVIKENVLFSVFENVVSDFRCVQVMWSMHDDIRSNWKKALQLLADEELDLKVFNRITGDLFFNMLAIKFREEQILFPLMLEVVKKDKLETMFVESLEMDWPYRVPKPPKLRTVQAFVREESGDIDLGTGVLLPEQVRLMMNHLPVDITYVDEHNKVRYFSTPKKRIFPRTHAIIGRDVHNCHPPESVHVVEQIVEAFRAGRKDEASFWIHMKGEFILIQYFALRNENNVYKGVIEVTQEISEIQELKGDQRLLDWEQD